MPNAHLESAPVLRDLIAAIPPDGAGYGRWWDSTAGRSLAEFICGVVAPTVVRGVRARTMRSVEPGLVLGLVVEACAPPSQLVRGVLSPTTADALAYLSRSLVNALAREIGTDAAITVSEAIPVGVRPAPAGLASALGSVCRELRPLTPPRLRPTLLPVVEHVVDRALDGALSRLHTRIADDERLLRLGWTRQQLRAIVNVVIGARPDHARASLIAGFLTHHGWQPGESPAHRAGLESYARRMTRSEVSRAQVRAAG